MVPQNERKIEMTTPVEAKPPPLFESLTELRVRQGDARGAKHRVLYLAGMLLIGGVVFGALYLAILFLE